VPFSFANHSWQVTASLGIAITEDQPQRFGLALERADEGLYLAKKRRPRPGGLGRPGTTNFLAARRTRGLSAVSLTGPESSPRPTLPHLTNPHPRLFSKSRKPS
jgi:hypothetical protein